ncbi:effector-associated constant component EACC1 [Streptomyces virginiae]
MSANHAGPAGYRISIVDEDPLRARREARELLAAISDSDPQAALDIPQPQQAAEDDLPIPKGGPVTDLIGLVFSGGSMVAAGIQIWLARVPQRTIVVTRPDGATLSISGKQARADDAQIERFLSGGSESSGEDGPAAE